MKRFIFTFVLSLVFILSFTVTSFAGTTVSVPYAEPSTSDTQGYISLIRANGYVDTFYWSVSPISEGFSNSTVSVTIDSNNITFTMGGTSNVNYRGSLIHLNTSSNISVRYSGGFTSAHTIAYTPGSSYYVAFRTGGNLGTVTNNIGSTAHLNITFGADNNNNDIMSVIDDILFSLESIDTDITRLLAYIIDEDTGIGYFSLIEDRLKLMHQVLINQANDIDTIESRINAIIDYLVEDSSGTGYPLLIDEKLKFIYERLGYTNQGIDTINTNLSRILAYLVDSKSGYGYPTLMYERLGYINQNLNDIEAILEDFAATELDESTDPLPNESLNDYESDNSALRDDADVSSELDSLIGNGGSFLKPFSGTFTVIWQLVDRILSTHSIFMSLATMVLTIGVVNLILNRR